MKYLITLNNNNMKLTIELINAKWHVNGKDYKDMSTSERQILGSFIAEINKELINQTPNDSELGAKIRKKFN
jgi:hypothetical protein